MVSKQSVDRQLKRLGINYWLLGRQEMKELANILFPNELILNCVMGFYASGTALLVATDQRVLLIDKKLWFLTLEDLRYDMITEIDYRAKLFNSETTIHTITKKLEFSSWSQMRLRKLTHHVQEKLMLIRQAITNPQHHQQGSDRTSFGAFLNQSEPASRHMMLRPRMGKFTLKTLR